MYHWQRNTSHRYGHNSMHCTYIIVHWNIKKLRISNLGITSHPNIVPSPFYLFDKLHFSDAPFCVTTGIEDAPQDPVTSYEGRCPAPCYKETLMRCIGDKVSSVLGRAKIYVMPGTAVTLAGGAKQQHSSTCTLLQCWASLLLAIPNTLCNIAILLDFPPPAANKKPPQIYF